MKHVARTEKMCSGQLAAAEMMTMTNTDAVALFDQIYSTLPVNEQMRMDRNIKRLMGIKNMGVASAKEMLLKVAIHETMGSLITPRELLKRTYARQS